MITETVRRWVLVGHECMLLGYSYGPRLKTTTFIYFTEIHKMVLTRKEAGTLVEAGQAKIKCQ